MLSPKARRDVLRIVPYGLIWFVFSIVYCQLEKGLLGNLNYYPSTGNPYDYAKNIIITPLFSLLIGLLTGSLEILYINRLFTKQSFTQKVFYKSLIYLAIIISFLILLTTTANALELKQGLLDKKAWNNALAFFLSQAFFSVGLFMACIILICQFYSEVSDNIGQVVLTNLMKGKYHSPKVEERIYMFLDMKSSTTIAERLGHTRYFEMLKQYFADLSDPIITHSGEIYQYVGDEMVVSWTLTNGLSDNNCILCFFAMKAAIRKQSAKYIERFGVVPEFKAGYHFGQVTTGEVGMIKKEIIFTGDVLNTTARIQELCNSFGVEILISGSLINKLQMGSRFETRLLGTKQLRGRNETIELYTIERSE